VADLSLSIQNLIIKTIYNNNGLFQYWYWFFWIYKWGTVHKKSFGM